MVTRTSPTEPRESKIGLTSVFWKFVSCRSHVFAKLSDHSVVAYLVLEVTTGKSEWW